MYFMLVADIDVSSIVLGLVKESEGSFLVDTNEYFVYLFSLLRSFKYVKNNKYSNYNINLYTGPVKNPETSSHSITIVFSYVHEQ